MFKRLWGYIKTLFRVKAEAAMDPEIEIEQAIQEARKRDQELRNQAAKVVAHRTVLESSIGKAADEVGSARELAKQALLKAQDSTNAGDAAGADKWTKAAQSMAMRLTAGENNLNSLKSQFESAVGQADDAKKAVQQNAMRLSELAAKRMELVGSLQQAKMQESVNKAVEAISATMGDDAVSMDKVEQKIEQRKADAMARAELSESTPQGAEMELREAVSISQADSKLAELKAELGIGEGTPPALSPPPGN
ncbi:MAG TPA: PspA/IM30 family protein [Acidimicrobiia bacterium]|nr:PspA/IM30 family protein [Acidimicrobiia bacterium]